MDRDFDTALKVLCDPTKSWGKHYLQKFTGLDLSGYTLQPIATESMGQKKMMRSDILVLLTADHTRRKIHLEFQSSYDSNICIRCLRYISHHSQRLDSDKGIELQQLPNSYIIDATPKTEHSVNGQRTLKLRLNGVVVDIPFPVFSLSQDAPEIWDVVESDTVLSFDKAIGGFIRSTPFTKEERKEFGVICDTVARMSQAYAKNLLNDEDIMEAIYVNQRTYFDEVREAADHEGYLRGHVQGVEEGRAEGREEGREEGRAEEREDIIAALMQSLGKTKEEVLTLINKSSKTSGLSSLTF